MPPPSTPPAFVTPSCGFLGWGWERTRRLSFKGGACYPARTLGNTTVDAEAVGGSSPSGGQATQQPPKSSWLAREP